MVLRKLINFVIFELYVWEFMKNCQTDVLHSYLFCDDLYILIIIYYLTRYFKFLCFLTGKGHARIVRDSEQLSARRCVVRW